MYRLSEYEPSASRFQCERPHLTWFSNIPVAPLIAYLIKELFHPEMAYNIINFVEKW